MNDERRWYAVYTAPRHERAVCRHLDSRGVESFLPTWESARVWKNRQVVKVTQPLFPSYLFVRITPAERITVLGAPSVMHIVGTGRTSVPIPDLEIDFLRSEFCRQRVEPYRDLVVGERVRIKSGLMRGFEGVLTRNGLGIRFIVTLDLISQHAAVEVNADELEPLPVSF